MSRIVVGPFNRVEGDLEVSLDVAKGEVAAAWVNSPLYRGFEQILEGRDASDGLVIAPRICGICSLSQSAAAAAALADAVGARMPPNGRLAANLALAAENIADHVTHFYLFFMPDFTRPAYGGRVWHAGAMRRFAIGKGDGTTTFLAARARFLHVVGILAGKWPHTLAFRPGGTTKAVDAGERVRLLSAIAGFRRFLEGAVFAAPLERMVGLDSMEALEGYAGEGHPDDGDFRLFLTASADLGLDRLGRAYDRFMSYGAYPAAAGEGRMFARGIWEGTPGVLDTAAIVEDLASSWMAGEAHHPARGTTRPDADKPGAYSWCKAPRLAGRPVEVGALARQVVDGHPLALDMAVKRGGNVMSRVVARLIEAARLVLAMQAWAQELRVGEPFCDDPPPPENGEGAGLVEAARGSLGHWVLFGDRHIRRYQIVAPTTWNFSPRDGAGVPGPLEKALVGTPVKEGEKTPLAVQHVVRSFDPCMVCTVH